MRFQRGDGQGKKKGKDFAKRDLGSAAARKKTQMGKKTNRYGKKKYPLLP